jgi:predicted secreted protein
MRLTLMTSIVVYFITWWVVLFMILPIGIRQDHAPIIGNDLGAPQNPNVKQKLIIVTVITTILFGMYVTVMLYA